VAPLSNNVILVNSHACFWSFPVSSSIYLTFYLFGTFSLHTELLEKKLSTLDIVLKRDKEEMFFMFANFFLSSVVGVAFWQKDCAKMAISEMAMV